MNGETLTGLLKKGQMILAQAGIKEAGLDAWLLLEYVTGKSRAYYFAYGEESVTESVAERYLELISRRAGHIPLQHLTHQAFFMGYEFYVNENVLVPRQDTETLVEKLLMYEEEMAGAKTSMEYFEADFRYHKVFFDHCGNRFMKETYKQYNFIRTLLIRYAIRTEDERDLGIRQHRGITQAFQKKDYEKARKLMEEHYLSGMQLAREHYREGDTFRENKK